MTNHDSTDSITRTASPEFQGAIHAYGLWFQALAQSFSIMGNRIVETIPNHLEHIAAFENLHTQWIAIAWRMGRLDTSLAAIQDKYQTADDGFEDWNAGRSCPPGERRCPGGYTQQRNIPGNRRALGHA